MLAFFECTKYSKVADISKLLFNRLEEVIFATYPDLLRVKSSLEHFDFCGLSVSGSGSAFFGLCNDRRPNGSNQRKIRVKRHRKCICGHKCYNTIDNETGRRNYYEYYRSQSETNRGKKNRLQAFCSITIDNDFVVRDLKIIEGYKGAFVAMPSRKLADKCTKCGCKNHLRARFCNDCGTKLDDKRIRRIQR